MSPHCAHSAPSYSRLCAQGSLLPGHEGQSGVPGIEPAQPWKAPYPLDCVRPQQTHSQALIKQPGGTSGTDSTAWTRCPVGCPDPHRVRDKLLGTGSHAWEVRPRDTLRSQRVAVAGGSQTRAPESLCMFPRPCVTPGDQTEAAASQGPGLNPRVLVPERASPTLQRDSAGGHRGGGESAVVSDGPL